MYAPNLYSSFIKKDEAEELNRTHIYSFKITNSKMIQGYKSDIKILKNNLNIKIAIFNGTSKEEKINIVVNKI